MDGVLSGFSAHANPAALALGEVTAAAQTSASINASRRIAWNNKPGLGLSSVAHHPILGMLAVR